MKRRDFIAALGSAAAWPLVAHAQQRVQRVGVMVPYAETDIEVGTRIAAFRQELRNLGWSEGRNIVIEYRFVGSVGERERIRVTAEQLVGLAPDVILADTTAVLLGLQRATRTLPIVFVSVASPIDSGFVASLARPGGNITGFTNIDHETTGKWLELLKEITPSLSRALVIFDPTNPTAGPRLRAVEAAARTAGVQLATAAIHDLGDIDRAIDTFARDYRGGLIVLPSVFFEYEHQAIIVAATIRHRIPSVYAFRFQVVNGGLMSYGTDLIDLYRRAARYVDRILKGEKPADLPVQQPTKFQLVINSKAAKALGLEIPPILLLQADEVIE